MKCLTTMIAAAVLVSSIGCSAGRKMRGDFGEFVSRAGDLVTGRTPSAAAVKMEDRYFPDERREGINRLAGRSFGQRPPYTERYQQIATADSDNLVRATAIRALNRSRADQATPIFVAALDDPNVRVRLEAAKALANVPDDAAVAKLIKMVGDDQEDRDVRIAAADALRNYRKIEVARQLISVLNQRDFGVAWQARKTLVRLTGQDLKYDDVAWLGLLASAENPFG